MSDVLRFFTNLPSEFWMFHIIFATLIGLVLDHVLGEVNRFHPLVGFGNYANCLQRKLNAENSNKLKVRGLFAWSLAVFPLVSLFMLLVLFEKTSTLFDGIVIYFCIGAKSMKEHALAIYAPLQKDNIEEARSACAMIVSRDVDNLSENEIVRATVESTLENTNDAVIASLFWYLVGGLPLLVCHRLVNTLDAMWGYKTNQFEQFGFTAAKADDFMAWPSAKITALLFAITVLFKGNFYPVLCNSVKQARNYKSTNGGCVMAAGATALSIQLGGQSHYNCVESNSCLLGDGDNANRKDIVRSIDLMNSAIFIWIVLLILVAFICSALY